MALASLAPTCSSYLLGSPALAYKLSPYVLQQYSGLSTDSIEIKASNMVRFKGYSRKLVLRAINRGLIARVARRATIYIPCFGLYLACKVFSKDIKQAMDKELDQKNRALMAIAAGADLVDIGAQSVTVAGILSNIAPALLPAALLALQPASALGTADHVSLTCALISCTAATWSLLRTPDEVHIHH